jgi:hypothetical protein
MARHWFAVEDFVRQYRVLIERTENRPSEIRRTLNENPNLADSIKRLHEIQEIITETITANMGGTDLFQAHPEFGSVSV